MTTTERTEDGQFQARRMTMERDYAIGQIAGGPRENVASAKSVKERFFALVPNEIDITRDAIDASINSMQEVMKRLGVQSMYGCAKIGGEEPDPDGDLSRTLAQLRHVQERARELRGLCETLEARL